MQRTQPPPLSSTGSPSSESAQRARPRVLLAESEPQAIAEIISLLSDGYDVMVVPDRAAVMAEAWQEPWDMVLTGVSLPLADSLALIASLRADDRARTLPVIVLSPGDQDHSAAAMAAGAADYVARPFAQASLQARVGARIETARMLRTAALDSERRMRFAMDAANMYSWEIDLASGLVEVSGDAAQVVGISHGAAGTWHDLVSHLVHPDDRASVQAALTAASATGTYHREMRLVDPLSGRVVWIEAHGTVVRDAAGQPARLIGVTQNISARKQSEAAAMRGREQLQLVSDNVPALISYVDADRRYRWCNRAYTQWFGLNVSEVVGHPMRDVVGEAAWATIGPHIDAALGGERAEYEAEARYRTGGTRWIHAVYTPHRDETGAVVGVIVMVHDVSEQRRAADALRESSERFDLVKDGAQVGFWFCDLPFDKLIWDNRVKEHFWLPPDADVTIDTFYAILHPDDREPTRLAIETSITNRAQYDIEYRTISPDGREKWIRAIGRTFADAAGKPIRFDGVTLDTTARRRTEDALRESEARFRNMADHAPVIIWMTDAHGSCTYLSKSWYDFTGQTAETALGMGWLLATHPDDRERAGEIFMAANQRREPFRLDYRLRRADGSYSWAIDSAAPRFGPEGEFLGYIGSVLDIAERKEMEEALRENDRRKDEFLAMLAHELRNPLAPIRHAAQVLKATAPGDARQEWARGVIERQTQHITRLVDDLLDVSRITQRKIALQRERVEIAAVVDRAVEASRPLLEARRQRLTVSVPSVPLPVEGDFTRLVQVAANLLNNAVKFTEEGGQIEVFAAAEGRDVVLRVRDNGVGISPELLPHVFDLFTQADPSLDRAQGGLGIGLTLVRLLVGLHGGSVEASSAGSGKGSEFTVRLPKADVAASSPVAAATMVDAGPADRRVLVVEDNVDSAEMLSQILQLRGYRTEIAHDGAAALDAARTFRPHIMLCDIGLPGMSGYEVAKRLRALLGAASPVVIALSGYGQDHDRRRAAEAGFDHHLTKPVEPEVLFRLLESVS